MSGGVWVIAALAIAGGLLWSRFGSEHPPSSTARNAMAPLPPLPVSHDPFAVSREHPSAAPSEKVEPQPASAVPVAQATSARRASRDQSSEAGLMAALRQHDGLYDEQTLELARVGNERFPDSTDAPERSWIAIRSLVDLRRLEEARAAARELVQRFPDSDWARDARRHLLSNPPGPPAP